MPRASPRLSGACCSRDWSVPSRLAPTAHGLPDRTQGDFSRSIAMLHGAPQTVYTDLNGLLGFPEYRNQICQSPTTDCECRYCVNWRKKRAFPSSVIGEGYGRHSPPHFGEITLKMPLLRHPGMTLAFFARLLREPQAALLQGLAAATVRKPTVASYRPSFRHLQWYEQELSQK